MCLSGEDSLHEEINYLKNFESIALHKMKCEFCASLINIVSS